MGYGKAGEKRMGSKTEISQEEASPKTWGRRKVVRRVSILSILILLFSAMAPVLALAAQLWIGNL